MKKWEWKHTPGKWSTCNPGCKCMQVSGEHHPIANVESGEWGDTYPAIRLTKGNLLYGMTAEAYTEMCSYGNIPEETAWANARLIASAPDMLKVCEKVMEFQDVWFSEGKQEEMELIKMAAKVIVALEISKEKK